MNFQEYIQEFAKLAQESFQSSDDVNSLVCYATRLHENGMPIIFDQVHFSKLLGNKYEYLLSICNCSNYYYKEYAIPKRNGQLRIIHEPLPSLKEIQNWILVNILNSNNKKYVSPVAKAYVIGRSIRDNARFHKAKSKIVSLDIVDFFGNISFKQVYYVYRKFGYSKAVSTMLTNICLFKGSLPQGSPTSPMLSNLIFYHMDEKIFQFCQERNIMYTRYADDLSFSGDFNIGELINFVEMILKKNNFQLNLKKTRIVSKGRRQQITGIVVNNKIQVPRFYRKEIRQIIYYIIKFGLEEHLKMINYKRDPNSYIYHIIGRINFVISINNKDTESHYYLQFMKELLVQRNMINY